MDILDKMLARSKEVAANTVLNGDNFNQNLELYSDGRVRLGFAVWQESPIISEDRFYMDVMMTRLQFVQGSMQIYQISSASQVYKMFQEAYRDRRDFPNYFLYLRKYIEHYFNRNQVMEALQLISNDFMILYKEGMYIRCLELVHVT